MELARRGNRRGKDAAKTYAALVLAEIIELMTAQNIGTKTLATRIGKSVGYAGKRLRGEIPLDLNDIEDMGQALGSNAYQILEIILRPDSQDEDEDEARLGKQTRRELAKLLNSTDQTLATTARKAGLTVHQLLTYLNGKTPLTVATYAKICTAAQIPAGAPINNAYEQLALQNTLKQLETEITELTADLTDDAETIEQLKTLITTKLKTLTQHPEPKKTRKQKPTNRVD